MTRTVIVRRCVTLMLGAVACSGDRTPPADSPVAVAGQSPGAGSTRPAATAPGACVLAELWSPCLLKNALENAGLAPQEVDSVHYAFFKVAARRWKLGRVELQTMIYPSVAALQGDLARFDTLTAQPRAGSDRIEWERRPETIASRNLLAFLTGGNDRQRERIRNAIEAGLLSLKPR